MFLLPSGMFLTDECREPNHLLLLAPPPPHSSPIALIHTQSGHLQLAYNRPQIDIWLACPQHTCRLTTCSNVCQVTPAQLAKPISKLAS